MMSRVFSRRLDVIPGVVDKGQSDKLWHPKVMVTIKIG